jgi:diaminopimelate decarboxylase
MLDAGALSVIRKRQPIEQLLDLEADGGSLWSLRQR